MTVVVWLGISLGLLGFQSVKASPSANEFTFWLQSMAKSSEGVDLKEKLDELRSTTKQLDELITKASQIISRNEIDFRFPIANSTASHQIYQLLFFEWTQFQSDKSMAAVPVQKSVKPIASFKTDHPFAPSSATLIAHSSPCSHPPALLFRKMLCRKIAAVEPMSWGSAINAP